MYLNRSLIKRQAKEILKGNIFKLFVISLVISIITSAIPFIASAFALKNYYRAFSEFIEEFDDFREFDDFHNFDSDHYDNFDYSGEGEDFYNFGKTDTSLNTTQIDVPFSPKRLIGSGVASILSNLSYIASIFLAPLAVALAGFYVLYIRGRRFEIGEGVKTVFKEAFTVNYLRKVWLNLLIGIISGLLSLLFIIPGIIFAYSAYFANQIMCDYPELSAWEAVKLSKKIIKGNRFELFLMNLSFIPWAFLCVFIFPIVYVVPYFETTNALYYENFRLRAIQQGRITEDDFLSDAQRYAKYAQANGVPNMVNPVYNSNQQQAAQPAWTPAQRPEQPIYTSTASPQPNEEPAPEPAQQQTPAEKKAETYGEYYTPPVENTEEYYTPPTEENPDKKE